MSCCHSLRSAVTNDGRRRQCHAGGGPLLLRPTRGAEQEPGESDLVGERQSDRSGESAELALAHRGDGSDLARAPRVREGRR